MKTVGTITGVVLSTLAVATAAFIVSISLQGTVTTGAFQVFLNSAPTATATAGTCAVSQVDAATLNVDWTGGIAGDTCTVTATFQGAASNARDAVLENATSGALEIPATLGADCGATIAGAGLRVVTMTLTVSQAASPGTGYPLTGSFVWVPSGTENLTSCV